MVSDDQVSDEVSRFGPQPLPENHFHELQVVGTAFVVGESNVRTAASKTKLVRDGERASVAFEERRGVGEESSALTQVQGARFG